MANNEKLIKLATRVKYLRSELAISQEELAHRCGFDRTYISLVERSKRNPSYLSLKKLCIGLEVNLSKLLEGL